MEKLDHQAISTLRCLSVDQIEAAKSGHPGLPLGAAPMAYALWKNTMKFDPTCPNWPDRDRFYDHGKTRRRVLSLAHPQVREHWNEDAWRYRKQPHHPTEHLLPRLSFSGWPHASQFQGAQSGQSDPSRNV